MPKPIRADSKAAADGGLWHQEEILRRLALWRADPIGLGVAIALFGTDALSARRVSPLRMDDPAAKPDFGARIEMPDGSCRSALISAKLIRGSMTRSDARPAHHASRVKFEEAHLHGLLPESSLLARSALLEHFIDGEPLSAQPIDRREAALDHLAAHWGLIARSALEGLRDPKPSFLLISVAESSAADASLSLSETRVLPIEEAIRLASSGAPSLSAPRDGQIGTIGTRWMTLQRGQALSSGPQRDIQTKINAAALFGQAPPLPAPPKA